MKNGFISYSHEDEVYCNIFIKGIQDHSFGKPISFWHDGKIPLGTNWYNDIISAIQKSDFSILALSSGFINSSFIQNTELPEIFNLFNKKPDFKCFPLLIAPCDPKVMPEINKLQRFVIKGKDYGFPNIPEITFSDLVRFDNNGTIIPNPNRDRFYMNFIEAMIKAF